MTQVGTFKGKNIDLKTLYSNTKKMLVTDKFGIKKDEISENAFHIKAEKTGVARIILGATRDVSVVIAGEPDAFAVTLSVGSWEKNLAIPGGVGFVAAGPAGGAVLATGSYITAKKFENDFWKKINDEINKLTKKSSKK